jgi:pilus assembly protein CpaF
VVHQERMFDGSRKVTRVTEVQGMEQNTIVMQDIFVFRQTGVEGGRVMGRLTPVGIRPRALEKLERYAIRVPPALFQQSPEVARSLASRGAE